MPRAALPALAFALFAGPAAAWDVCAEWWFTRNQIYDRAGYCFQSTLGQAMFGNEGCSTGDPKLDPWARDMVAYIEAYETEFACEIDTSSETLDVLGIDSRLALADIPVPAVYESGCFGWQGAPIALYAGRDESYAVTGLIDTGDDIYWTFEAVDGWNFVISVRNAAEMGWYRDFPMYPEDCSGWAG